MNKIFCVFFVLLVGLPAVFGQVATKNIPLMVVVDNLSVSVYCENGVYSLVAGQTANFSYVCQTQYNQTVNTTQAVNVSIDYDLLASKINASSGVDYNRVGDALRAVNLSVNCPSLDSDALTTKIGGQVKSDFTNELSSVNSRLDEFQNCKAEKDKAIENMTGLTARAVSAEAYINTTNARMQDLKDQHNVDLLIMAVMTILLAVIFVSYTKGAAQAILEQTHKYVPSLPMKKVPRPPLHLDGQEVQPK